MRPYSFSASRLMPVASLSVLMLLVSSCSRFNARGGLSTWGYALLALDILALIDVFNQPWEIGKKVLWAAIIFFAPFLGLLAYFFFSGRGKA